MIDPIVSLIKLNDETLALNELQEWIDHARTAAPTNQAVQLELDRQQTEVNEKRELIEELKFNIAIRN